MIGFAGEIHMPDNSNLSLYVWDGQNVTMMGGFYANGILQIIASTEKAAWSYLKEFDEELYWRLQQWGTQPYYYDNFSKDFAQQLIAGELIDLEQVKKDQWEGVGWSTDGREFVRGISLQIYLSKMFTRYVQRDVYERAERQYLMELIRNNDGMCTHESIKPRIEPIRDGFVYYQREVN